jgi:hypothetical protein
LRASRRICSFWLSNWIFVMGMFWWIRSCESKN